MVVNKKNIKKTKVKSKITKKVSKKSNLKNKISKPKTKIKKNAEKSNSKLKTKLIKKTNVKSKKVVSNINSEINIKNTKMDLPDINDPSQIKKYFEENYFNNHHHKKTEKKCFLKSLFSGTGFYKFVWFPVLLLLFVIFTDFFIEFVIYSNIAPVYINLAKNTLFFSSILFLLFLTSVFSYFYIGYSGANNNFRYNKIFKIVFNIVIFMFVIETILIFISYFTFLKPYLLDVIKNPALQQLYLYYLIVWVFVKSVLYLVISSLAYLITSKLKFIKY